VFFMALFAETSVDSAGAGSNGVASRALKPRFFGSFMISGYPAFEKVSPIRPIPAKLASMLRVLLISGLIAVVATAQGAVKTRRVEYHGWKGCFALSNGTVELIYVPQIGRIMRYGYAKGPNILWENGKLAGQGQKDQKPGQWANYGGDKLWPAPQSLWNWPPDPILDGSPHTARFDGKRLVVEGPPSTKSGVRMSRIIELDATGTGVKIHNTMTNVGDKPLELALWQIAQVNNPDEVILPIEPTPEMPDGWAGYDDKPIEPKFAKVRNGEVRIFRNPAASYKLGSPSSAGRISSIHGKTFFHITATKEPGGKYPDDGKFLQVYLNQDPDQYAELELTGPITSIPAGGAVQLVVRWSLESAKKSDGLGRVSQ